MALLRGINVGGRKQVAMADLRDGLAQLGFGDPRSLLASGNLVVRSAEQSGTPLERLLEAEVRGVSPGRRRASCAPRRNGAR